MQFIISFGYVLFFYSLLAIISIILLDLMWIKRTQFFIIDQKISNGFQGLYLCIKLIFSKDIIKIRQYYGNDIFLYIYSLKVMMFLCFIIYICQISINIFENLLIDKQIYFWDFFIINKSNKQCVNNEFCFLQRFINLILISIFILLAIKDIYETIQNCCLDFLQDHRKGLQIRTFLIHTYKEEGLQVINEINYFLANQNLGNIQFYQLLDNQQYKYKIQQKEQYYSYMKDYCLDKQINNDFKNCLIPSSYYQEQFYQDKFYKLKTKLQCEDFDQFSGAILICLERPTSIQHLIDNFKSEYNICDQFQFRRQDYKQLQVQNNIYSIQQITDSVEIVWQNVTSRFKWENYKKLLINLAAIFIILFLTTPSTLIHFLQVNQITKNLQEFVAYNSLQKQVLNNLQTLLILLFNQLLLVLIQKIVFLEGHICYSNFQISNFNKTTRYLMLNMLIMPFIAVKATDSLYFLLVNQSITYKSIVQQQFTYDQSLKFFTLIIQSGFLTFFSSIIRIDELIFNYLSPKIANDLRNIQKNIFNGFQYGYFSGIVITTMAIVLFLTKNVPMICLAGCLYLFFRLLVDTYNLTAVFKQEMESNGKFTQRFCQILAYTYFCILIYETGVLYYNQCIYLASILLLVSAIFYIIIDQKLNSSIYFKCIDDLYIDNLDICKDDRKKWLNLFKNPNYKQL